MMGGYGGNEMMWNRPQHMSGMGMMGGIGGGGNPHMQYIGGTAYFGGQGPLPGMGGLGSYEAEPVLDTPPGGFFSTVDCKWKEMLRVPVDAIQQVTKACSTQRHLLRDKGKKNMQTHPNICEDFHEGFCAQGMQCKLFHLKRSWLEQHRRPHQDALELARQEFLQIQKEKKSFTVFCPSLKETLPVPAHYMHFTRGLFLREEERAKRQAQHGGKHTESHQNPSVCQLFIKGGGDRQCKWGELCNQAHPNKEWLAQRHEMSVKYVEQCKKGFLGSSDDSTWDALDPDTNERVTIPKQFLRFTRGLFSKEFAANRVASICMLYLKQFDGAGEGSGCTAGELCNQVHVDLRWIIKRRVDLHIQAGDYDETRHQPHHYQGIHFPAGRRAAKWAKAPSAPQGMFHQAHAHTHHHHHHHHHHQHGMMRPGMGAAGQWWSRSPHSDAASMLSGSSMGGLTPLELMSALTPSLTPPSTSLEAPTRYADMSSSNIGTNSFESKSSALSSAEDGPKRSVADWLPQSMLKSAAAERPLPALVTGEAVAAPRQSPQRDTPPLLASGVSGDALDDEALSVLELLKPQEAAAAPRAAAGSSSGGSPMVAAGVSPATAPEKSPLLTTAVASTTTSPPRGILSLDPAADDDDDDDDALNLEALASMISTLGEDA